jgi:hypothetical protein
MYNFIVLLPSVVYLVYLNKKERRKILIDGFILGVFAEILFDIFAHQSKSWYSPSMFDFRPLGLPVENFIWNILYVWLMLSFYVYFFDAHRSEKLSKFHRYWILLELLISIIIPIIYFLLPNLFVIPYFYLVSVVCMIVFEVVIMRGNNKFATKAIMASLALLPLAFIHEFVSLEFKHWIFEVGYHIGYLNLFGYIIPFEELMFYVAAPIALICIYEIFMDNRRA